MTARTRSLLIAAALLIAVPLLILSRSLAARGSAGRPVHFAGPPDQAERFAQAAMAPYAVEELYAWFGLPAAAPAAAEQAGAKIELGGERAFRVYDDPAEPARPVTATLEYAGPVALMYVDRNVRIDRASLRAAAQAFETEIVPQARAAFGAEARPDERLAILHTSLAHAGGYYSPMDATSRGLEGHTNPRKLLVIGVNSYQPGTGAYLSILAHEFQHMIHAHRQASSPAWFNEGLSTLAQDLIGHPDDELGLIYLAEPATGLTGWAQDAAETGSHYGAANLFLRYYLAHYGELCDAACLLREDAGNRPDVFARHASQRRPDIRSFADLVADWAVANVLNDPTAGDGRYAYPGLPAYASVESPDGDHSVEQYGVRYLGVLEGPLTVAFDGEEAVALTGAQPAEGERMWWSNRGDGKYAALTRAFDLGSVSSATLHFSAWYEIERHFDYGYVTVSVDAGRSWRTLPGRTTTQDDPQEQNLGHGLTGVSGHPDAEVTEGPRGRWLEEQIDLTPYAGREILLRFWLVNDAGFNAAGLLLDRICIPEIGFCDHAEDGTPGWQAEGFVRTTGGIAQPWEVRLAVRSDAGITVRDVPLDARNRASIRLGAGEEGVLVVLAAAEHTGEPARFRVNAF